MSLIVGACFHMTSSTGKIEQKYTSSYFHKVVWFVVAIVVTKVVHVFYKDLYILQDLKRHNFVCVHKMAWFLVATVVTNSWLTCLRRLAFSARHLTSTFAHALKVTMILNAKTVTNSCILSSRVYTNKKIMNGHKHSLISAVKPVINSLCIAAALIAFDGPMAKACVCTSCLETDRAFRSLTCCALRARFH